jgi:hypothetical protein
VYVLNRCWANSIIPYNARENRLPKRTGRAEVTVLPVDFRPRMSARWKERSRTQRKKNCEHVEPRIPKDSGFAEIAMFWTKGRVAGDGLSLEKKR